MKNIKARINANIVCPLYEDKKITLTLDYKLYYKLIVIAFEKYLKKIANILQINNFKMNN